MGDNGHFNQQQYDMWVWVPKKWWEIFQKNMGFDAGVQGSVGAIWLLLARLLYLQLRDDWKFTTDVQMGFPS